jgi:hypothetical protein
MLIGANHDKSVEADKALDEEVRRIDDQVDAKPAH